jgi:hypothetical protein
MNDESLNKNKNKPTSLKLFWVFHLIPLKIISSSSFSLILA